MKQIKRWKGGKSFPPIFNACVMSVIRTYFYGVYPFSHTHEGAFVGTVVQQKHAVRPPEVRLGYTSEPCKKDLKSC